MQYQTYEPYRSNDDLGIRFVETGDTGDFHRILDILVAVNPKARIQKLCKLASINHYKAPKQLWNQPAVR